MTAFVPLVFLVGALAGAATVAWFGRRRNARSNDDPSVGRAAWPLIAVTSVATVVLTLAVVYGIVRWQFRSRPVTHVSVDDAVNDFRQTATNTAAGKVLNGPAPGVYRYKGTGFYEVNVPIVGKERRDLSALTLATVVHSGPCWEQTIRFFSQHSWTARYCRAADGAIAMEFWKTANEYFGRKLRWSYACLPANLVRADDKPGATWQQLCRSRIKPEDSSTPKVAHVRFVGVEDLQVNNATIRARHIQRTITTKGRQSGQTVRDLWFSETNGLLVQLRERSNSTGLATFRAQWQVALTNTTPAK